MEPSKPEGGDEDIKITRQEMNNVLKALEKPEFQGLLEEYVDEISDPKNKAEQEAYLKQMEAQNDLPTGTKLVRPTGAFCIKTHIRRMIRKQRKDVKYVDQKVFINLCSCPEVDKPTKKLAENQTEKGYHWSLPYTLSKGRAERDRKNNVCMVYDVIFHPECIQLSQAPEFRKFVCDSAIDGLNQYLKQGNETCSHDYKLMNNLKCKGGHPAYMTMKVKSKGKDKNKLSENLKVEKHQPQVLKEITKQKEEEMEKKRLKNEKKRAKQDAAKNRGKNKPEGDSNKLSYKLTYSYDVDLINCFDGPSFSKNANIPRSIFIKIDLPGVKSLKDGKLDINEKQVKFQIEDRDSLEINLAYPVLMNQGKAKFDKSAHILNIELPINKVEIEKGYKIQESQMGNSMVKEIKTEGTEKEDLEEEDEKNEEIQSEKENEIPYIKKEENKSDETEGLILQKENNEEKATDKLEIKYKEEEEDKDIDAPGFEKEPARKPLIEEISSQSNFSPSTSTDQDKTGKDVNSEKEKIIDLSQIERISGEYKLQQAKDFLFIMFNVKNYSQDNVQYTITSNEFQIIIYDPSISKAHFLLLTLFMPIIISDSQVQFVRDYVILKLKKQEEGKVWQSAGYPISKLSDISEETEFISNNPEHLKIMKQKEEKAEDQNNKEADEKEEVSEEGKQEEDKGEEEIDYEKAERELERRSRTQLAFCQLNNPIIFSIY
jgi:hypothetical protein